MAAKKKLPPEFLNRGKFHSKGVKKNTAKKAAAKKKAGGNPFAKGGNY